MGNDLHAELKAYLDEYVEDVSDKVNKVAERIATQGVKDIKAGSPKKRPEYYKGWTKKKETIINGVSYTLYNKTHPGLTHLLEHGHATVNGGRTRAIPHIGPVEQSMIKEFEEEVERIAKG